MPSNWIPCNSLYKRKKDSDLERIIEAMSDTIACFFALKKPKNGARTRLIKRRLTILGHDLKYKVYANRLSVTDLAAIGNNMRNVEWLYDLHWYTESGKYAVKSMPLVMECEWNNRRGDDALGGLKYDFQKLVVSNSPLRLMVFCVADMAVLETLDLYLDPLIQKYESLVSTDQFLFIAFCWQIKGFYFRVITAGQLRRRK